MPTTRVQVREYESNSGSERTQYRTTIPKDTAELFEMDGDTKLKWTAKAGGKLELEVVND